MVAFALTLSGYIRGSYYVNVLNQPPLENHDISVWEITVNIKKNIHSC